MWGQYHNLRTSEEFLLEWKRFLSKMTEIVPCSAFIQHATHQVFKQVQFQPTIAPSETAPLLTDIEINALRYVASYVCRTSMII